MKSCDLPQENEDEQIGWGIWIHLENMLLEWYMFVMSVLRKQTVLHQVSFEHRMKG